MTSAMALRLQNLPLSDIFEEYIEANQDQM